MYLRSHPTLRDDMEEWQRAFAALYEASPFTVRLLLAVVATDDIALSSFANLLGPDDETPGVGDRIIETFLTRNDQVKKSHLLHIHSTLQS